MASLTQWTWVWANSGRWWRTGKPGVLQSMGPQRVGHDWDWTATTTQPLWRTVWRSLKKLKLELLCDPAIPLLGICPEKNMAPKETRSPCSRSTAYNSKTWRQPECPPRDKRIKKMRCTQWSINSHSKEWNTAICSNMDGPRERYTDWSQSDREGEIPYNIRYMWNLKRNDINELTYRTERHKTQKTNSWLTYKTERDSQTEHEPAVVRGKA